MRQTRKMLRPNATLHLPPEAEARHERTLEAVRCKRLLGNTELTLASGGSSPVRFDAARTRRSICSQVSFGSKFKSSSGI